MKTPRIGEMVYKAIQDEVAGEMWYESRQNEERLQKLLQNLEKRLIRDTTTALTEAHQAGRDEAVKVVDRLWEEQLSKKENDEGFIAVGISRAKNALLNLTKNI